MAKDGTSRGGARPGAGRKPKAITEKVADGNPGGRKLTVVDFGENAAELTGEEMPPVSEFMKAVQKDGSVLCAEDIFKTTWTWLRERRCDHLVPTQIIEQYAMAAARWVQCEEYVSTYGRKTCKRVCCKFSLCEHQPGVYETGQQHLVSDLPGSKRKLHRRTFRCNAAGRCNGASAPCSSGHLNNRRIKHNGKHQKC